MQSIASFVLPIIMHSFHVEIVFLWEPSSEIAHENVCIIRNRRGPGLINIKERIQAIQVLEDLKSHWEGLETKDKGRVI